MGRINYLYRRPSGIYVVRICVPARLKSVFKVGEMHISTGSRDLLTAQATQLQVLAAWQARLLEEKNMQTVTTGDSHELAKIYPIFKGDGQQALGFKVPLGEGETDSDWRLLNQWAGVPVTVPKSHDGSFNEFAKIGQVSRQFMDAFNPANSVTNLSRPEAKSKAERGLDESALNILVVTEREEDLLIADHLAERQRIRNAAKASCLAMAGPTSARIVESQQDRPSSAPPQSGNSMLLSDLIEDFLDEKKANVKPDQLRRIGQSLGYLVEVIGDVPISEINRLRLKEFAKQIRRLPSNPHRLTERTGFSDFTRLAGYSAAHGLELISNKQVSFHLSKVSELFTWAYQEQHKADNPALKLDRALKRTKPARDARDQFDQSDFDKIFGASWFVTGAGKKTRRGDYYEYQPFYYWLPLLGAYTGARLNELAQLYLRDIRQSDSGQWFLDFNLDGEDKVDADDKSLKNGNSVRQVPISQALVNLGFLQYVARLKELGHSRLFPELRFDETKGYGKQAGAWFNERFLGNQLGILRNGRKSFHSFRHTFITGMYTASLDMHNINQISGHTRASGVSGTTYRKDSPADALVNLVNETPIPMPTVARFNIDEGIKALDCALKRKARHAMYKLRKKGASKT